MAPNLSKTYFIAQELNLLEINYWKQNPNTHYLLLFKIIQICVDKINSSGSSPKPFSFGQEQLFNLSNIVNINNTISTSLLIPEAIICNLAAPPFGPAGKN